MKTILRAVALLALVSPVFAAEFHLTDATGRRYGPFEFKQGETLSVAGQEYTISKVLTKEQEITEKMKAIIIPQVEFRQADVRDVVSFLQQASVEFDPQPKRKRGVSAVLDLGPPAPPPEVASDPFEADPFAEPPKGQGRAPDVPRITFSARYISLHDALNITCKICDLQWSVRDSVVMIEPKNKVKQVQQQPKRDR